MAQVTPQEQELLDLGYGRYQKQLDNLTNSNLSTLSDFGLALLKNSISPVMKHLKEIHKFALPKITLLLDYDVLSFIGLSTAINYMEPETPFMSLAYKVGKVYEQEVNAENLKMPKGVDPDKWLRKQTSYISIPKAEKIHIGTLILLAVENTTNILKVELIQRNNKTVRVVSPSKSFKEYQDAFLKENCYLSPVHRPLLNFPIPLNEDLVGGYSFDVLAKNTQLKQVAQRHLRLLKERGDSKRIAGSLNKLQSIPYEIDGQVLDVAWVLYQDGHILPELRPLPKSILKIATDEERKKFLKRYHVAKKDNNSLEGKRINLARTLMVAKEFEDKDHFYFPSCIDFRGRIYYHGDYLNPQGTDLSKALLRFKQKAKIDNDFFYYIHGANVAGFKGSYQERYDWTEEHIPLFKEIAEDPIGKKDLWMDAEGPFEFLAFCFDVTKYLDNPEHESGLRCSFDASQSGLQILSLLLRDKEGCERVNVLDSPHTLTEGPADAYMACYRVLDGLLSFDAQSGLEPVSEHAKFWIDFLKGKKVRNLVKKPLMTTVYSLSRYGLQQSVEGWVREFGISVTLEQTQYLGGRVKEAIDSTVKGATKAMNWIKEVTAIITDRKMDVELLMPNGFYLVSSYRQPKSLQIRTKVLGDVYYTRFMERKEKGRIIRKKSINASVPNIVHALDASILFDFLEHYPASKPISTVHDSIQFRGADADIVYEGIRDSFVNIFAPNLLLDFKEQLEKQHGITLPDLPDLGTIDFEDVRSSSYIFH
jgi:DNA-directed RNA polymerase, mitochondrial